MARLGFDLSTYGNSVVPDGEVVACHVTLALPKEGQQGVKFPSFAWQGRGGVENIALKVEVVSPEYKGIGFWEWHPCYSPEQRDGWKIKKSRKLWRALAAYKGERACIESLNVEAVCVLSVWRTRDGEERNSVKLVLDPREKVAQATLAEARGALDPEEYF